MPSRSRTASILTMDETFIRCQLFEGGTIVIHHTAVRVFRLDIGRKNPLKILTALMERAGAIGLTGTIYIKIVIGNPQGRKVVTWAPMTMDQTIGKIERVRAAPQKNAEKEIGSGIDLLPEAGGGGNLTRRVLIVS